MRLVGTEQNELMYSLACKCSNCFATQDCLIQRCRTLEQASGSLTCFTCGCKNVLERDYQRQRLIDLEIEKQIAEAEKK